MLRSLLVVFAGSASLLLATPAHSAPQLYEGSYVCSLSWNMILGNIWLYADGTFVGPSFEPDGPRHPFEITESNTINWGAPLGGMDSGGNKVVGTVVRDAGGGKAGFDIQMQLQSGNFSTASCAPDF
ncbi:MAG TPA: hypothetical protein VGB81_16440 [Devosia sp.]|jgi:hypothetical protein